jgi:hypothetical protein
MDRLHGLRPAPKRRTTIQFSTLFRTTPARDDGVRNGDFRTGSNVSRARGSGTRNRMELVWHATTKPAAGDFQGFFESTHPGTTVTGCKNLRRGDPAYSLSSVVSFRSCDWPGAKTCGPLLTFK